MKNIRNKKFKLSHLFLGIAGLLIVQGVLMWQLPSVAANETFIVIFGIIGSVMNIYVSVKAIEEVKGHLHMLLFLSFIILEFILFFAVQYWFLMIVQPTSYPTLPLDALSLILHSTMVFVFNPLFLPATTAGRALLLVNTFSSLCIVLFILQNIWQLRTKSFDTD